MPQSQTKRATVLSSSEEDNDDDSDDGDNRYRVSYVSYKTLVFYPTLPHPSGFPFAALFYRRSDPVTQVPSSIFKFSFDHTKKKS